MMEVSPNALRKETVQLYTLVDSQIQEIEREAKSRGVAAVEMRDERGNYVLPPLLHAKAMCLNTLTLLSEQGRRK